MTYPNNPDDWQWQTPPEQQSEYPQYPRQGAQVTQGGYPAQYPPPPQQRENIPYPPYPSQTEKTAPRTRTPQRRTKPVTGRQLPYGAELPGEFPQENPYQPLRSPVTQRRTLPRSHNTRTYPSPPLPRMTDGRPWTFGDCLTWMFVGACFAGMLFCFVKG